jgi:hypothetical protein
MENEMCNCYLLTQRGTLMPATTDGIVTDGLVEVAGPTGKVYSCAPQNLVSQSDGEMMLRQKRAEQLAAEGYDAKRRGDGSYRVYSEDRHGEYGGYNVTETSCTCPDFQKRGRPCKHMLGLCGLLHIIVANKRAQRKAVPITVPTATETPIAAEIAPATRIAPSARLAAMIAHDGWE